MEVKILPLILTCIHFSRVQGAAINVSHGNYVGVDGRRIINGMKADPSKWMFTVRLEAPLGLCGGSIVSNHWILTAAHCMHETDCKTIEINPSNWKDGDHPKYYAAECIPHESWKDPGYENDVGLIRTAEDLVKDGGLKTIELPSPKQIFNPGTPATIAGWGQTLKKEPSDYLLSGNMKVQAWRDCNPHFQEWEAIKIEEIPREALCVIGNEPKPDGSCFGDSGGPIVINGRLAANIVAGIHDVDNNCIVGTPTLGLAMSFYVPWINTHIHPGNRLPIVPTLKNPRSPVVSPSFCNLRKRQLGKVPGTSYRR